NIKNEGGPITTMTIFKVPEDFAALAHLRHADYQRLYEESIKDPHGFWARMGRRIDWIQPYTKVKDTSFDLQDFRIRWYYDGKLNVSANCLDRHLTKRGDKIAIIWEGDDPRLSETITYRQLYERVCQCANALKSLGVQKGDRVTRSEERRVGNEGRSRTRRYHRNT